MRTRTSLSVVLAFAALLASSLPATRADAQAPDLRAIRPDVVLLIDTSGSMEYNLSYVPAAGGSIGCAAAGACPTCSATPGLSEKNRWTTLLEALTGSWPGYTCTMQGTTTGGRTTPFFSGQYDATYPIPYFQPPNAGQLTDGVLDAYVDRVKFGLMTFDGAGTLVPAAIPNASGLVSQLAFGAPAFLARSNGWEGMYSYGPNKPLLFPGCDQPYMVNAGSRAAAAPAGGLISVGNDAQDYRAINQAIQQSLIATRSYGATPIAAMLEDARTYFDTNADVASPTAVAGGDPYYQCRQRYALLITDGYPDSDFRGGPFNCDRAGATACCTAWADAAHTVCSAPASCICPYATDLTTAATMCNMNLATGKCDGSRELNGLFVVGMSITDAANIAHLNDLARIGGTTAAYLGNDRTSLLAGLSAALDTAASTVNTRTAPAFANGSGSGASATQAQYQFNTGFVPGTTVTTSGVPVTTPWSGVIERRRYVCDSTLTPVAQPLDDSMGDRFQKVLNTRAAPRNLYTVIPANAANVGRWLTGPSTGTSPVGALPFMPAEAGLPLVSFAKATASLNMGYFGVATAARRDAIIDYVHGVAPAARAAARLGDIYHSTPVVVSAPPEDVRDESFNYFRQRADVSTRPTVVYVGTNDGVLHAFSAGTWTYATGPHAGTTLAAGEELWGFIPPAALPKLDAASTGHQSTVDGTPVVREVFFRKTPGAVADASNYHTTLLIGLRGTNAYEALDVTDPLAPQFLWQYADATMGMTYGQAGVGQVLLRNSGGSLEERGIAILPGGTGALNLAQATATGVAGCPASGAGAAPPAIGESTSRNNLRCWQTTGRNVTVMDMATGEKLAVFDSTRLNAPMTGSVSLFTGDTGTIATRAFMSDQDGVLWRLDMGNPTISQWKIEPFADMFFDGQPLAGQPAYNPPILSVDQTGNVVVLQGTGDIDALDATAANRVTSLTEQQTCPTPSTCTWRANLNWEVRLASSEQVTGPMELYNGVVYFGTFQSVVDPLNACTLGNSKIWGLAYIDSQAGASQPTPTGKAQMETTVGSGTFAQYILPPVPLNSVPVMGVGVTQQPTCFQGSTTTDPYFGGSRYQVGNTGGGQFQLVAQFSGVASATSVSVMTRQLPSPRAYTAISSWTGTTD